MKVNRLFLMAIVIATLGCSYALDFEPSGRPCTPEGECLPGYACILEECQPSRSIGAGETCFQNTNCKDGLVCFDFICSPECTAPLSIEQCPEQSICEVGSNAYESNVLACTATESCKPQEAQPCPTTGEICYATTESSGHCLASCSPSCAPGALCDNACEPNRSCQYLQDELFCLPAGTAQPGEQCSLNDNPCAIGATCLPTTPGSPDGVCRNFCDRSAPICPGTSSESELECQPLSAELGFCGLAK